MQMVDKSLSDNGGAALFSLGTALRPLLNRANMIVINAYYALLSEQLFPSLLWVEYPFFSFSGLFHCGFSASDNRGRCRNQINRIQSSHFIFDSSQHIGN